MKTPNTRRELKASENGKAELEAIIGGLLKQLAEEAAEDASSAAFERMSRSLKVLKSAHQMDWASPQKKLTAKETVARAGEQLRLLKKEQAVS